MNVYKYEVPDQNGRKFAVVYSTEDIKFAVLTYDFEAGWSFNSFDIFTSEQRAITHAKKDNLGRLTDRTGKASGVSIWVPVKKSYCCVDVDTWKKLRDENLIEPEGYVARISKEAN